MNNSKLARALGMVVFISSSVTAFSLGMLSYTLVTGELPMGILSQFRIEQPKPEKETRNVKSDGPGTTIRLEEQFMKDFYDELLKQKEKIAAEGKNLTSKQMVVEEIKKESFKMQAEIEKLENKVKNLLIIIDKKEEDNIKKLAGLISGLEPASGAKMLMEYNDNMAARILYFMNQKKAAELVGQIMNDPKNMERMKKITKMMQMFSGKLEGEQQQ